MLIFVFIIYFFESKDLVCVGNDLFMKAVEIPSNQISKIQQSAGGGNTRKKRKKQSSHFLSSARSVFCQVLDLFSFIFLIFLSLFCISSVSFLYHFCVFSSSFLVTYLAIYAFSDHVLLDWYKSHWDQPDQLENAIRNVKQNKRTEKKTNKFKKKRKLIRRTNKKNKRRKKREEKILFRSSSLRYFYSFVLFLMYFFTVYPKCINNSYILFYFWNYRCP